MNSYDYSSYGATRQGKGISEGPATAKLNASAILFCLLAPIALFAMVDGAVSFSLHYESPPLCWLIVSLAFVVVAMCCWLAYQALAARMTHKVARDPTWYTFLAISMLIAWSGGLFHGSVNYGANIQPYNDVQILSSYPNVNVSASQGQQLMDAGRVTFVEGTKIDMTRSMGFKNLEEYCVAPIIANTTMGVYDFWAVGMNCCSGKGGDFHCGEFDNPRARSGLRLLREDQRPFYRLAVQQAEATFGIASEHPMFFYWAQDATLSMEAYRTDAWDFYYLGVLSFVFLQFFLMILTICAYQKVNGSAPNPGGFGH